MFSVQLLTQAAVNGVLLGGVYALLALGLNLLFGVVRIAFLAYGDLVMLGMYIIYLLTTFGGVPLGISALVAVVSLALLGMVVHQLIIDPILDRPGVNQLLATGGLLVFLENLALVLWGADYRTLYVSLPRLQIGGLFISAVQLITFGGALVTLALLYLFLTRTFVGTAIRAVAQDREGVELMGVNPRLVYLITAGLGGALAGVVSVFFALQYS
ncbi:MAG: branched-chain amino acid ABC transporter permease, partial [Nitrospinota bacterium]